EFNEQLLDFADEVRSLKGDDPDVARIYKKYDLAYYASEVPEMLAEMKEGIDRIARIVNSLKSFSGLESRDEWNYVDINKSLDEMLIVSKNEYKYDIQVDFHRGTLPPIYCCDKELNQAFLSVFLNSIQAVAENRDRGESRGRGRIAIDTEFSSSRDAVLISFRDNGAPFPEEDMGKILDPFFSGWSGKGGSGLGLALVNDIVAFKHRGDVELFGGEDKRVLLAIPVNLNEIVGA
ncbi:MAG: ATP-binding protein, partial [Spirochaetales bacterium]|nr:ATP-binding protein [Spirochaetales bacterium]